MNFFHYLKTKRQLNNKNKKNPHAYGISNTTKPQMQLI